MKKRRSIIWILAFVGWMLVGMSFTLNYYLFADHYVALFQKPPTLKEMLVWELPYWLLWFAMSPLIFSLTKRFRIQRDNWNDTVLVHLLSCFFIAILHRAVYLLVGWMLHVAFYNEFTSLSDLFRFLFLFNLPTGFLSYGTIFLICVAFDYYSRYVEEEVKAAALKAQLAEAQLQALKMQLQPHFLFNTLNSISALLDEDVDAADEMLARLGDFLRITLENSGAQTVTLQEELEFLRRYLDIEKVRFQDRLQVHFAIEPPTLAAKVPNLILQPLIENAIRHGIAERIEGGQIEVRASLTGDTLRLQVSDDGAGINADSLNGNGRKEGVGLANTRARLARVYGEEHHFTLEAAPEHGTLATIEIPFISDEIVESARAI